MTTVQSTIASIVASNMNTAEKTAAIMALTVLSAPAKPAPKAPKAKAPKAAPVEAPVVQATPLPGARSKLLPGTWATVTTKAGVTYRKRVPANGSTVGQRFTGVGTDKTGARVLVWEVRESKAGVRYYGVAA